MADSCPRLLECTDVNCKGDSKKMKHCFNCCERADHAPVDCPFKVQRWRVHTNGKRFFEALESGEEWKPIRPGQHELKSNAHSNLPPPSHSTPRRNEFVPSSWALKVTGPQIWNEAEAENCMSLASGVESAERGEKELLLHFISEVE